MYEARGNHRDRAQERGRGNRRQQNSPCAALFDLCNVKLKEAVEPADKLLSMIPSGSARLQDMT